MRPFLTREMLDGLDRFWRLRSHLEIAALPPARRDKVLPYIRAWVASATRMSAAEAFHGFSQMAAIGAAALAASAPFDFVISPTAPVPAFQAEQASPLDDPERPFEHIAFTLPANFSEQPAASVHCGLTRSGLPVGLQIVGRRFDDLGVLQFASAFERLRGAPPLPPLRA
jgi:Asp-tRNA(Asn)/Glu-tRNA(Gln) amidotransferase A subunit family amidase